MRMTTISRGGKNMHDGTVGGDESFVHTSEPNQNQTTVHCTYPCNEGPQVVGLCLSKNLTHQLRQEWPWIGE
jgi:hypothetical protein